MKMFFLTAGAIVLLAVILFCAVALIVFFATKNTPIGHCAECKFYRDYKCHFFEEFQKKGGCACAEFEPKSGRV